MVQHALTRIMSYAAHKDAVTIWIKVLQAKRFIRRLLDRTDYAVFSKNRCLAKRVTSDPKI